MTRRLVLLGSTAVACSRDRRPYLNVYNWSSYVAPETIPDFEREFGVRVRYSIYESNEEMLAKVITGNSGWDVVFPTHYRIPPMIANRLLAPMEHDLLPNLGNLEPRFQNPSWDPGLRYSVPYMWNATGIAYSRVVPPAPVSWADLWNAQWQHRLTMLDDPEDVLGACLLKLGFSFDSTNGRELEAAKQTAIEQKRLLRAYLNAEVRDQLVSGDVLAAQMWSTTAQQAMDASSRLAFAFPREGFPLYADNAVILRESTRTRLAHQFINYLLRPDVAARIVHAADTATANGKARALLPPAIRDSVTLYPPSEVMARGVWPVVLPGEVQRLRDRIWTEIKSA